MKQAARVRRARMKRAIKAAAGGLAGLVLLLAALDRIFPPPLARLGEMPASPAVTARDGAPMLALVGADGQWRRPAPLAEISPWLRRATLAVEDARFARHPGVDPIAVLRAARDNALGGRVVSGASTITMQLARMLEPRPRTMRAKLAQALRAFQIERRMSKDEILEAYLNLAPYGRNVRGAEAAARFWFGKSARDLSLGEATLLAGLPQSPSRFRPDTKLALAKARQKAVLARMAALGWISEAQSALALAEPLDVRLRREPARAEHAAWHALGRRPLGGRTTIDLALQGEIERLARACAAGLPPGTQISAVAIELAGGEIRAMLGALEAGEAARVNGALARRSPGSALKPFIYAAAFESGRVKPETLLDDRPFERAGWNPENFDRTFGGSVPAAAALRRSLNIPAIAAAERAGLARTLGLIEAAGVDLPEGAMRRGGLAVAVGGIEVTLLDLTNGYATLAREGLRANARIYEDDPRGETRALDEATARQIGEILSTRIRAPRGIEPRGGRLPLFSWKTGTSAGRRDAWAVGFNGSFAIGVWAGKFSGEGHPAYVGAEAAEPLMARIFALPGVARGEMTDTAAPEPPAREAAAPIRARSRLAILEPSDGLTYRSPSGPVALHPRANLADGIRWFLNGRALGTAEAARLELAAGRYEIRCVSAGGDAAEVAFVVR